MFDKQLISFTGLGIVTMRYADHMRFCAVADEACLSPEALDYFLKEVSEELKELDKECSDFEMVIHQSDKKENNGIIMPSSNTAFSSYVNPKNVSINTVTLDFRRGSVPTQIVDTIE